MTPMPSTAQNQFNMFRQQEAWNNLQVMQCMLGVWNKQQNFPNQMNPAMFPGMGFTNCDGLKFYAFPADHMPHQSNQGWGMVMSPEMAPKVDWGNNFHHFGSFEPEMPDTLKDFVEKALDCRACWDLQDLIPDCSNAELKFMASQLRGHVREVVESPHGNHVLQRMLEFMAPKSLHFVLEELMAWAPGPVLARHRYGCRVLERVLEHFHESAIQPLLEDLLYHAKELCLHPFGNFVMQIFMEHAPATYRKALIEIIGQNIVQVAGDHNGCAVLEKGLSYGEEPEQKMLVKAILKVEGLLPSMKSLRGGTVATERVLDIATGWALSEAQRQLQGGVAKMINKGRQRWRQQESGRNGRRK